jgi:Putative mono-oxygenase ydhR
VGTQLICDVRHRRLLAMNTSRTHLIRFVPEIITSLVLFTESHSSLINCRMDNLITVVTRFQLPAGVTADQIRAAFDEAAPGFRNVPGLVRKQFLRSKDCRTAGGFYLWNDERAARAFMNERVAPMIREKFHVEPTVEFYDSPVIVEN